MIRSIIFAALLQCTFQQQYQQKVAPGVPPQSYQNYQPPPQQVPQQPPQYQQQQYQQPPQQYQPPPQQQQQQMQQQQMPHVQQQVPQMQQQVPQMQQHQPHGQQHAHHGDPQLLNPVNIASEREHIQEHMDVPIDTSKMTEQELQFHYFKMHDSDNNNKLDGCELIKSLIHWHDHEGKQVGSAPRSYTDEILTEIVENAMKHTDKNNDGFIDYGEYKAADLTEKYV